MRRRSMVIPGATIFHVIVVAAVYAVLWATINPNLKPVWGYLWLSLCLTHTPLVAASGLSAKLKLPSLPTLLLIPGAALMALNCAMWKWPPGFLVAYLILFVSPAITAILSAASLIPMLMLCRDFDQSQHARMTPHCAVCGYLLTNLPDKRCPECGESPARVKWTRQENPASNPRS